MFNNIVERLQQPMKSQSQVSEEEILPLLLSPINLQEPYIC